MRNFVSDRSLLLYTVLLISLISCKKDDPASLLPPPIPDQSFIEEFDTATAAYDRGWRYYNVSQPKGDGFWTQGGFHNPLIWGLIYVDFNNATDLPKPILFNAFSSKGSYQGFIASYFDAIDVEDVVLNNKTGVISNWVVSPSITMKTGDKIVFYTRNVMMPENTVGGGDSTDYGSRLQVLLNETESVNVGEGENTGDFKKVLLDINPNYTFQHSNPVLYEPNAYPSEWTRFEVTLTPFKPFKGRFALRYYNNSWWDKSASTGIAIDHVEYISAK